MDLKAELLRGVYAYGFERISAIQQRAIMPVIKGHDVIAQAQSGTGKTATFSISVLQKLSGDTKSAIPSRLFVIHIAVSDASPALTGHSGCLCAPSPISCNPRIEGRDVVNTNPKEDKPDQAQQCPPSPEMFSGNTVVNECDMDSGLNHTVKGAGVGPAHRPQPTDRSSLQLPACPHRGLHCALVDYHSEIHCVNIAASTCSWLGKEGQLKKLHEEFILAINKFVYRTNAIALEGLEEEGAGELLRGKSGEVKSNIMSLFLPLLPPPPRVGLRTLLPTSPTGMRTERRNEDRDPITPKLGK
ncbi:hypothetical protein O988_04756 [Pseudogymnoascus sp. VKM F-3808]|nr:hypothetical protein O988_04756 [Pseudogymnoascus sp. VKM F-3808]